MSSVLLAACVSIFCCISTNTGHAQEVRVQDQRGHTVILPKPAERVVAIPLPMASVVMALDGSSRRVVGMHPGARQSIQDGFLRRIFPDALSIRADVTRGGGFNPNLETVLQLRPDIVLQWTEPAEVINALDNVGIAAAGLINDPPTQEVHERNLDIVGAVIGQVTRTQELIGRQHKIREEIDRITATIPMSERPRVLYFRTLHPSMTPAGPKSYQDFWIKLVGGRNVADAAGLDYATINLEQILIWNPQVIFLGAFDNSTPEEVLKNPPLQRVDAVRDRRVYKLPHGGYRWDPGSHESHLGWQWAAMLMHPSRFRFDLFNRVRETYKFIYGYDVNDADFETILQMPLNRASLGYAAFAR